MGSRCCNCCTDPGLASTAAPRQGPAQPEPEQKACTPLRPGYGESAGWQPAALARTLLLASLQLQRLPATQDLCASRSHPCSTLPTPSLYPPCAAPDLRDPALEAAGATDKLIRETHGFVFTEKVRCWMRCNGHPGGAETLLVFVAARHLTVSGRQSDWGGVAAACVRTTIAAAGARVLAMAQGLTDTTSQTGCLPMLRCAPPQVSCTVDGEAFAFPDPEPLLMPVRPRRCARLASPACAPAAANLAALATMSDFRLPHALPPFPSNSWAAWWNGSITTSQVQCGWAFKRHRACWR